MPNYNNPYGFGQSKNPPMWAGTNKPVIPVGYSGGGGGGGGGLGQSIVSKEQLERSIAEAKAREEAKAKAEAEAKAKAEAEAKIMEVKAELSKRITIAKSKGQEALIQAKNRLINIYDIATGKSVSISKLSNERGELNKRVEAFNFKYGGRELSEEEYKQAEKESSEIEAEQKRLNVRQDEIARTPSARIYSFFNPSERRLTVEQEQRETAELVSITERDIASLKKLQQETKVPFIKNYYSNLMKTAEGELEYYRAGGKQTILAGDLPLVPRSIISSATTGIKFFGVEQGLPGGKTLTTIAYRTTGRGVGIAKAISKSNGERYISAIVGASGKRVALFPSAGSTKVSNIKSFVGVERGLVQDTKIIAKNNIANLDIVRTLAAQKQLSAGKFALGTGKKLSDLKSGTKVSDFLSSARSITKENTSFIVGKSITREGGKATYTGIVVKQKESISDVGKISSSIPKGATTTTQTPIKSVLSSIAAAETGTGLKAISSLTKVSGVTKSIKTLSTTTKAINIPTTKESLKQSVISSTYEKDITRSIPSIRTNKTTRSRVGQVERYGQRYEQRTEQLQKSSIKQLQIQRTSLLQKQLIRSKQQLKLKYNIASRPYSKTTSFGRGLFIKSNTKQVNSVTSNRRFSVSVRRFGKFKSVGTFGSLKQAFTAGRGKVSRTLAATFRIEGTKLSGTPKGFYSRPTKQGTIFIERRGLRLKRGTAEIPEIQSFRRRR